MTQCSKPRQEAFLSRLRTLGRSDRGDVTSSVLMFSAVLLAIMMAVHFGLILHGRNVANAAAQDGLTAAQVQLATPGDGQRAARSTLALFPGIRDIRVDVFRTQDQVTVNVRGRIYGPLGNIFNDVNVSRTGPVERFYFETERDQ